jgi:hypothetical protein
MNAVAATHQFAQPPTPSGPATAPASSLEGGLLPQILAIAICHNRVQLHYP